MTPETLQQVAGVVALVAAATSARRCAIYGVKYTYLFTCFLMPSSYKLSWRPLTLLFLVQWPLTSILESTTRPSIVNSGSYLTQAAWRLLQFS